jgi:hypothetical protein
MNIDPKEVRIPRPQFQVTQEHIDAACRKDIHKCMISLAVQKHLPDVTRVETDIATIRFTDPKKGLRYTYLTPPIAQKALVDFDDGIVIQPFAFRVKTAVVTSATITKDGKQKDAHKLGQPRVRASTKDRIDIIGGKPPPRIKPKHPSHSSVRKYGARGFIDGWKTGA